MTPRPDLGGENRLQFDQAELGNNQAGVRGLRQRLHLLATNLRVIQLRERAGVDEVPRHLTFVSFSGKVGVERTRNLRKRGPNRFPADAAVRERLEAVRRLKLNVLFVGIGVEDYDADKLVLF